jgi:hypothetical protein
MNTETLISKNINLWWLRAACLYFVTAVGLGLHMGASGNHMLMYVHVHTNLLGWVCCALFGILATLFKRSGSNALSRWHFWLHNLGLPAMMVAYAGRLLSGHPAFQTLIVIGSSMVGVAVLIFVFNLWRALSTTPQPSTLVGQP